MAVDRVERLLRQTAAALSAVGVDHAIIGGNAVAAWVATVDEGAVRTTKDVDILIRRADLAATTEALRAIDLTPAEVLGVQKFLPRKNPNPRTGVHVVVAGERIRPGHRHPAPEPSRSKMLSMGYRILDLPDLVAMKLQSYRFIDRAHIQDLLAVGLIHDSVRQALPPDLHARLTQIEAGEDA